MTKRPMCLICLVLIIGIYLWREMGNPVDSPLPPKIAKEFSQGLQGTVWGTVKRQVQGETTNSVYLKNTYLIFHSKVYPLQNLRVFLKKEKGLCSGDSVKITGKLYPVPEGRNPGAFDSRQYYAARKIYYFLEKGQVEEVRRAKNPVPGWMERFYIYLKTVMRQVAGEEGGILQAMVLGEKGDLENEVRDYYQKAGMLHLIAVSGLHLSFWGLGCVWLLERLGLGCKLAYACAVGVVWFYGTLIDGGPSTWRAILMFAVMAGGRLLGRSYDTLSGLALGAILLLCQNPEYLFYSGFLLSFGAVLGLAGAAELRERREQPESLGEKKTRGGRLVTRGKEILLDGIRTSLGVQLVTLPIVLTFYYEISLFGFFWNLLILPTAGVVLGFGTLGLFLGCFWVPLGRIVLLPGRLLLGIYLRGAKAGAALPFCTWVAGKPEVWKVVLYYGLLLCLFLCWRYRKVRMGLGAALGICVVVLGTHPRKGLEITCVDVGQGDGIVWAFPGGESFLVDGGSTSQQQVGRYQLMPYLKHQGIQVLDGIFVTHTDEDHISGIVELLEGQAAHTSSIGIRALYLPKWEMENEAYENLQQLAKKAGITPILLSQGMELSVGEVKIRVVYPLCWQDKEDVNGGSLVLELCYGTFRGIFTGDTGREQEADMLELLEDCDFLKVAHHGSKNSTCEAFLERTRPKYAFLSCSEKNRYGHPAPETLERLEEKGCQYWATKDGGALTLWTDGRKIRITSYLKGIRCPEFPDFTGKAKHVTMKKDMENKCENKKID